jgi:hypothetical protein
MEAVLPLDRDAPPNRSTLAHSATVMGAPESDVA